MTYAVSLGEEHLRFRGTPCCFFERKGAFRHFSEGKHKENGYFSTQTALPGVEG